MVRLILFIVCKFLLLKEQMRPDWEQSARQFFFHGAMTLAGGIMCGGSCAAYAKAHQAAIKCLVPGHQEELEAEQVPEDHLHVGLAICSLQAFVALNDKKSLGLLFLLNQMVPCSCLIKEHRWLSNLLA